MRPFFYVLLLLSNMSFGLTTNANPPTDPDADMAREARDASQSSENYKKLRAHDQDWVLKEAARSRKFG